MVLVMMAVVGMEVSMSRREMTALRGVDGLRLDWMVVWLLLLWDAGENAVVEVVTSSINRNVFILYYNLRSV